MKKKVKLNLHFKLPTKEEKYILSRKEILNLEWLTHQSHDLRIVGSNPA